MVDYTLIMFGILFGLSSPKVEQSLLDLDSPTFLVRQRASEYLKTEGSPYLFHYLVESAKPITLEKRLRMESITGVVQNKWIDDLGTYYDRQWQLEGDYADLLFGPNWPSIDYFARKPFSGGYWVEKRTNDPVKSLWSEGYWHSFREKCGCKELLEENFDYSYGYFVRENYYMLFQGTKEMRCYKYALEMEHTRTPYRKAATKVWAIDQLKKGNPSLGLSIVLAEVRRREYLDKKLLYYQGSRQCVRFYPNWEKYGFPFITIYGKKQSEVPDPFVWSEFE